MSVDYLPDDLQNCEWDEDSNQSSMIHLEIFNSKLVSFYGVIMLSVILLRVIMLSVILLRVVKLSHYHRYLSNIDSVLL